MPTLNEQQQYSSLRTQVLGQILALPVWQIALAPFAAYFIYYFVRSIYRLTFHPLAKFPGSWYLAISDLPTSFHVVNGNLPQTIKILHDKYGPVVRTAPDRLSFNTATSWKDIYGHIPGRKVFLKSNAYFTEKRAHSIVGVRDLKEHARMRKTLSHAFSAKALGEQEDIVHQFVDKLISQLNVYASGPDGDEFVKWCNFVTFDIIGDLAFGEPFGSLNDNEMHYWISGIVSFVRAGAYMGVARAYPLLRPFRSSFAPRELLRKRRAQFTYAEEKVKTRMEAKHTRKDFFGNIIRAKEIQNISKDEMTVQAVVLTIAGSETTATFLSGVSYHLCCNPRVYKKFTDEIRSSYNSYDEITNHKAEHLPYLNAVINEGLRIYPPVPTGPPRDSPGEIVDGYFIPKGTEVGTTMWGATHSETNFHKAYEFKPERWLDPNCTDTLSASQPFLLGSRVCLGRNLAVMEMRMILSKMFWTYDMEILNNDLDWDRDGKAHGLWLKPAMQVRMTRREGIVVPPIDG